ncbi:MAG: endolytic transglycosylase MltG [Dysosmobacter welbionis]
MRCRTTPAPSPARTCRPTPLQPVPERGPAPTPISNPGLASIDAALNPNSTDYYYYALGTDGKHHFSTTLAEHNAFVNSSSYGG